jgi:hypothetical protein
VRALLDASRVNSVQLTGKAVRQLRDLTKQVKDYELLLNTLRPRLNPTDIQLVQDAFSRVGFPLNGLKIVWIA